jgi:hypothetical protein
MKATLDIPDDLYRQVKARSALEGRPLRSVAIQLFQTWLDAAPTGTADQSTPPTAADETSAPWLAVTRRYLKPDMSHDMEAIRAAIAKGWAAESAEVPGPTQP